MKERKGLHPAIAFVLMLVMVTVAMCYGANKHWREEKAIVTMKALALEAEMEVRAETAHNLLTVAYRYLPKDDALCTSVSENRAVIRSAALPLADRMEACAQFSENALALLTKLKEIPLVLSDSRDQMYVQLMLPQAVELCEDISAFTAYDQAAEKYNKGLGSTVSGVLAHLMGYKKAPRIDGMQPAMTLEPTETSYPMQRSYINDDAAVLGAETVEDVNALNERLWSAKFTVATRHFLGGNDVQEYCKGLFDYWQLDADDVLLLLVIGEERYAVCMGDQVSGYVSSEQLGSLMSTHLRAPFVTVRDYDGAVGNFLMALSRHIVRASGEEVDFGGLFGTEETVPDMLFDNWSGNWWEGFFAENDYNEDSLYKVAVDDEFYEAYEVDYSSLLVLAVVFFFVIRRRRRQRKTGFGWLGWLILISMISQIGEILGVLL